MTQETFSALPLWREGLETTLEQTKHQASSRYLQFASIGLDARPKVRTLVFRGFIENSDSLVIHTDIRTEKHKELDKTPDAEISWYFTETREQFRIAGKVNQVTKESNDLQIERSQHWQNLSTAAKLDYYKPVPGIPLPSTTQASTVKANTVQANTDIDTPSEQVLTTPHENFVLLIFKPEQVDHVMLMPSPHQRVMHSLQPNNLWESKPITP